MHSVGNYKFSKIRGLMTEERMTLTVGQPFGSTPPQEGYLPVINGSSFDIIAFYSGISQKELQDWFKGDIQYVVYIENSIPVFILYIGKAWSLDVFLNIHRESEEIRREFFEGDPHNTQMHLTLVSFEDSIVQGIRTIAIDPNIMANIKEACFYQLSVYSSQEDCHDAAEKLLDRYGSQDLRDMLKR